VNSPTATHASAVSQATELSTFEEALVFGDATLSQREPKNLAIDVVVLTST
jgi:hypothetical protein